MGGKYIFRTGAMHAQRVPCKYLEGFWQRNAGSYNFITWKPAEVSSPYASQSTPIDK
jgi:hypothetical protein